jgi:diguanylate cyclase (GGDEF)-like protein
MPADRAWRRPMLNVPAVGILAIFFSEKALFCRVNHSSVLQSRALPVKQQGGTLQDRIILLAPSRQAQVVSDRAVGASSDDATAARALRASTEAPALPARTRLRVLLIEDSEADYRATERLLAAAQHVELSVDWAKDLKGGLARLGEGSFDVCLLDQGLPDGDGLELVGAALRRRCRAPIIMLTGQSALELDLQAMAVGVADFLEKDRVDAVLLERTIRYALARQQHADHLSRLAQYDELTGLANRSLFRDRLDRALAWARRNERLAAVIILDLNGFKVVNDRLGHSAGDRLLGLMAKRLTSRLRETDTVARLGGDEFAVVIENLAKPEHAALVARKLLDTVAPPLEIDGQSVTVTASLGLALYPKDSQDAASLIREADRAMYRAKAEGGNLCRFASDQMERRVQRGTLLVTDLRRGLAAGELVLHYQPQVTLTPGAVGISAMIRWNHPELGLIGSERFLPLAEDHGLLERSRAGCSSLRVRRRRAGAIRGLDSCTLPCPSWHGNSWPGALCPGIWRRRSAASRSIRVAWRSS